MSKRDVFHPVVKSALQKDGWVITADPLWIESGGINVAIDSPERDLFLAVPLNAYETFFQLPMPKGQIEEFQVKLLVYNPQKEIIALWKS